MVFRKRKSSSPMPEEADSSSSEALIPTEVYKELVKQNEQGRFKLTPKDFATYLEYLEFLVKEEGIDLKKFLKLQSLRPMTPEESQTTQYLFESRLYPLLMTLVGIAKGWDVHDRLHFICKEYWLSDGMV